MKKIIFIIVICASLLTGGTICLSEPAMDVDRKKHPNLAEAQKLVKQAYDKIVNAKLANEWDMGGHAQLAKEMLDQVNLEIKRAADALDAGKDTMKK